MKKEKSIIDLIDIVTDKAIFYMKKVGKLVNNKNSHDTVYIFTKVIITLLILWIVNILFDGAKELGIIVIYNVGSTFRAILSKSWELIVDLSYFIMSFVILLRVFNGIFKDKELNLNEKNRK